MPINTTGRCRIPIPLPRGFRCKPRQWKWARWRFLSASHKFESGRELEISDESEEKIQQALAAKKLRLDEGPFDLGDVSFHYGWTFHRAGPNTTTQPRAVMTVIYIEDGICVAEPTNKNQIGDIAAWMPGLKAGEVVATDA